MRLASSSLGWQGRRREVTRAANMHQVVGSSPQGGGIASSNGSQTEVQVFEGRPAHTVAVSSILQNP